MLFPGSSHFWSVLFYLLGAHALADYALQPDWMARYKSPTAQVPRQLGAWWWIMTAHALINGFFVGLLTHWWWLGVWETVLHFVVDTQKCVGKLTARQDQAVHLISKVIWASFG